MADRVRIKTRRQGDQEMVSQQDGFLGGMNVDSPASEIDGTEMAELYNYQPYRGFLKTRAGAIDMGDLPETGEVDDTIHQMFWHHIVGRAIMHRGTKLYVGTPVAPDITYPWGSIEWEEVPDSLLQPTTTKMVALGKDVVIFTPSDTHRLEWDRDLEDSYSFRSLTGAHPEANPSEVLLYRGPTDTAHLYRFLYTMARIVDGIVIAESGTPTAPSDGTDFVEYGMVDEYGTADAFVEIAPTFVNIDPTFWTHIVVYRTKDISQDVLGADGTTNDPERYYRMGEIDVSSNFLGIGDMAIGTTFVVSLENTYTPDDALTATLSSRFMVPMPPGVVGAVAPGLLFMATWGDTRVNFCGLQEGRSRFAGIYREDLQYLEIEGGVTDMEAMPDVLAILVRRGTHRITTYSTVNGGREDLGEFIPRFQGQVVTCADSEVGTIDWTSITATVNGKIMGHCSDATIRSFDGLQWTTDFSRNKIQRIIRSIGTGLSSTFYDPRGAFIIWYYTPEGISKCLRLGLSEDQGIGWSWYDGAGWPEPWAGVKVIAAPVVNGQVVGLVTDYTTNKLYAVEYDGVGTDRPTTDAGVAFTCSALGREIRGTSERHWVRHQQTYVFLRPIPGYPQSDLSSLTMEVSAYLDGSTTATATSHDVPQDERVVFLEEIGARRIQIGISATGAAHCVAGIETLFQSQDRATLWDADTLREVQDELATGMVFWSNREDPLRNSAAWGANALGTWVTTTGSRVAGPDGFTDSALRVSST